MHAAEGLDSHIKVTTEHPLLSTVWIPFVQTKPDVISFRPLKVVNQRPVEHASHINAFLDGSLNLQSAQGTPKLIYHAHILTCTPRYTASITHHSRERSHTCHTTCLLHFRPKHATMLQNNAHVLLGCAHAASHNALTCGIYVSKNFLRLSPVLSGMPVSVTYTGTCKLLKVLTPCTSQNNLCHQ